MVRMIDLARLHAPIRSDIDAAIARVVDSGRFVLGAEVDAFEREIGDFLGVSHAIGVSSGSDALFCALLGHDEVVVPALSFIATAEAVVRAGAKLVFADVDEHGIVVAPDSAKTVVAVDLFGRRANVRASVIDAAQSIGRGVLRDARAAAISFFPTKNLGAFGDGGLVATNDAAFAAEVRALRVHGATKKKYVHDRIGWNMRLDALQAAILRVKLPHLERWNAARKRVAARYRDGLAGLELVLPEGAPDHVWHQFVVRTPARDALRAHLASREIESEIYYPLALHLQPCFSHLGHREGDFPRAEAFTKTALALPIHPSLDDAEIDAVIAVVRLFFS
jgi:dTDP-4-amino-4,6-dideoxygalactose transaminase